MEGREGKRRWGEEGADVFRAQPGKQLPLQNGPLDARLACAGRRRGTQLGYPLLVGALQGCHALHMGRARGQEVEEAAKRETTCGCCYSQS